MQKMTEKMQVKDQGFYIHWCPCIYVSHFHILSLNMDLFTLQIIQNGE